MAPEEKEAQGPVGENKKLGHQYNVAYMTNQEEQSCRDVLALTNG